jgi:hypothetical protein
MCNLYSTTNQAAIIALFRVINRYVGNLPPMPGVFPDYPAPVVPQHRHRQRAGDDALGHAASTACFRPVAIRVGCATRCLFREGPVFLDSAPTDERA